MANNIESARKPVGAPRKYTPSALKRAVNRYFAEISRVVELTEPKWNGRYDDKGKPIYIPSPVLNSLGETATRREYIVKPSIQALCVYLGIHKDTWAEYSKREEYADICAQTKLEIERDRVDRLGSGKGDHGIEFDLIHNFGWRKEVIIDAGEGMQRAMETKPASMDEQLELLRRLGLKLPNEVEA